MLEGNCHVAAKRGASESLEAIAHGIWKHREVHKPLLVSLHVSAYFFEYQVLVMPWVRLTLEYLNLN